MTSKRKELILAFIMLIFCLGYFYFTTQINIRDDVVNSRTLPYILSFLMAILTISQFVKSLSITNEEEKTNKDFFTVVKVALSIVVYISLFESVGFIITSGLFLFVMFCFLTPNVYKPNYGMYILVSIVSSVLIYTIFRYGLDVLLPQGLIEVY